MADTPQPQTPYDKYYGHGDAQKNMPTNNLPNWTVGVGDGNNSDDDAQEELSTINQLTCVGGRNDSDDDSSNDDDDDDDDLFHIVARNARARHPTTTSPTHRTSEHPSTSISPSKEGLAAPDSRRVDQSRPIVIIAVGRTGEGKSSLLNDIATSMPFAAKNDTAGTLPFDTKNDIVGTMPFDAKIDIARGISSDAKNVIAAGSMPFDAKMAVKSITKDIKHFKGFWAPLLRYKRERNPFGCHVHIMDTPGFKDSEGREAELLNKTKSAIMSLACADGSDNSNSGVNVLLVVFKIYATSDLVMTTLRTLSDLLHPVTDFWPSVVLVFTHADYGNRESYRENKVCLYNEIALRVRQEFGLLQDLPMVSLSTNQHICQYTRGGDECDCKSANKYHADCRRRLYEQIWNRRGVRFFVNPNIDQDPKPDVHEPIPLLVNEQNDELAVKRNISMVVETNDREDEAIPLRSTLAQPFPATTPISSGQLSENLNSATILTTASQHSTSISKSSIKFAAATPNGPSTSFVGATSANVGRRTMEDFFSEWDANKFFLGEIGPEYQTGGDGEMGGDGCVKSKTQDTRTKIDPSPNHHHPQVSAGQSSTSPLPNITNTGMSVVSSSPIALSYPPKFKLPWPSGGFNAIHDEINHGHNADTSDSDRIMTHTPLSFVPARGPAAIFSSSRPALTSSSSLPTSSSSCFSSEPVSPIHSMPTSSSWQGDFVISNIRPVLKESVNPNSTLDDAESMLVGLGGLTITEDNQHQPVSPASSEFASLRQASRGQTEGRVDESGISSPQSPPVVKSPSRSNTDLKSGDFTSKSEAKGFRLFGLRRARSKVELSILTSNDERRR
ncbi:hypothetical protein BC936DRAFT_146028 [Jimgerdemannia flammicorona]|uniref:Uncharacterized protein n=1 Tax=Jimgerdemannia flammicorona TaxID=994334 RepID=A0A433D997_9FUNG|nr:hypothetical protein BC936DRAFT_146028 [Jimgerdemannia flammicorona]